MHAQESKPNSTYHIVKGKFTWSEAKADAEARGGHLATITSENEWQVVGESLGDNLNDDLWIGGYTGDFPGWRWVTGEDWAYDRWDSGAPNNVNGRENHINIVRANQSGSNAVGYWNDHADSSSLIYGDEISGYILELPR